MANTTNFNWETPDDTDLVKDGAAAIRTLGSAIDTSLVDLKGGTTNQVLAKNSNTDMDFKWVADASGIPATIFDAKGDLIVASAADTAARLAVGGTNGHVLTVNSGATNGIEWAAASSGAMTLIKRASFSDVANTGTTFDDVFTTTYKSFKIVFETMFAATGNNTFQMQLRYAGPTTQTTNYYGNILVVNYDSTTTTNTNNNAGTSMTIAATVGETGTEQAAGWVNVFNAGINSKPSIQGTYVDPSWLRSSITWQTVSINRTYTGFLLKSSSSNITGTVAVYGLA